MCYADVQNKWKKGKKLQNAISMHTMFIMAKLFQHENLCAVDALVDYVCRVSCQVLDPFSEWIRISFALDFHSIALCSNFPLFYSHCGRWLSAFFFLSGSECDLAIVLWLIQVLTPKLLRQYISIVAQQSWFNVFIWFGIEYEQRDFQVGDNICGVSEKYNIMHAIDFVNVILTFLLETRWKKIGNAQMRTFNVLHLFCHFDFVDIFSGWRHQKSTTTNYNQENKTTTKKLPTFTFNDTFKFIDMMVIKKCRRRQCFNTQITVTRLSMSWNTVTKTKKHWTRSVLSASQIAHFHRRMQTIYIYSSNMISRVFLTTVHLNPSFAFPCRFVWINSGTETWTLRKNAPHLTSFSFRMLDINVQKNAYATCINGIQKECCGTHHADSSQWIK